MNHKRNFKKYLIEHPFKIVGIIIILLILFEFLLLLCLKGIDHLLYNKWKNLFVRLEGGVETWFSFYGSYLGVVATVVLGIITLRLSIKVDQMNTVSQINTFNIKEIYLYDFWRDFKPSVMITNRLKSRYCFQIFFKKYKPYYKIIINKVEWGEFKKDGEEIFYKSLNNWEQYFEQNKQSILYIYCDDFENRGIKESLSFFYRLPAYEPITMQPYERKRVLKIYMKMGNELDETSNNESNEDIDVIMKIILENKGYENGRILLNNLDCKVKINPNGTGEKNEF